MSGMDRLTDEALRNIMSDPHWASDRDAFEMARELLAHRRASQAAPAPMWHGELSIFPETEEQLDKMLAAPAPSGGLREENERLRGQLRMIVSHATMGETTGEGMSVNEISVKITALRNELYQAGKDAALSASPAQEGGE